MNRRTLKTEKLLSSMTPYPISKLPILGREVSNKYHRKLEKTIYCRKLKHFPAQNPLHCRGRTGPDLSGPVRDTPPYRAIPFRDSIAEGGITPICLDFIRYRTSIAEIPLLKGGYRTSTSHALQGGNAQKRRRGYRTQLAMFRHQKPHSAQ